MYIKKQLELGFSKKHPRNELGMNSTQTLNFKYNQSNCNLSLHTKYSHNPRFELYGQDLFALKDNVIKSYLRGQIKRLSSMRLECRANEMTSKSEENEAVACQNAK